MAKAFKRLRSGAVGLIAALALAVGFTALPAYALDPSASLDISGTTMISGGTVIVDSIPGATYDEASNTLTFNNFVGSCVEVQDMDLNIVLVGDSTVNRCGGVPGGNALRVSGGGLSISGSGTMTATRTAGTGYAAHVIYAQGTVNITDATVNISTTAIPGSVYGIASSSDVNISGSSVNANIAGTTYSYGIGALNGGAINITNNSSITINVGNPTNGFATFDAGAINVYSGAVLREGDAAPGNVVSSLTLGTVDPLSGYTIGKRYASIAPASAGGSTPADNVTATDNTANPRTGDINATLLIASSLIAAIGVSLGVVVVRKQFARR